MRWLRSQRGEGQLGCIVGLIFLVAAGYVAFKMIPIKVKAAELRQTVTDSARSAGTMNDARIRRAILSKARDLELPLKERDLEIRRANAIIKIEAEYTVPVEFPGYTYQWEFRHVAENPIF